MATVHQENADRILKDLLSAAPAHGGALREQFDAIIPSWQVSAFGERGYSDDPLGDSIICIARCLHDALPAPFNLFPFDWRNQHGMNVAIVYLSQPAISAEDIAGWLKDAIAINAANMANV